jgi:hypothetical protein
MWMSLKSVGENGRRLKFRAMENKNNLIQGLLQKSKIIQYMFEKDHTIIWALLLTSKQAKHKIQEIKEAAHRPLQRIQSAN